MNIVVDENIPLIAIAWLRSQGHTVTEAGTPPLRESDDEVLWTAAQHDHSLLISTDRGFARKWSQVHFGVLLVILRQPNGLKIHDRIVRAMQEHTEDEWRGLLVIMRDQAKVIRHGPKP